MTIHIHQLKCFLFYFTHSSVYYNQLFVLLPLRNNRAFWRRLGATLGQHFPAQSLLKGEVVINGQVLNNLTNE